MKHVLLTKAKCWAYEHEWRLIVPEAAERYREFSPRSLCGLIFGCRTNEADRERVRKWVNGRTGKIQLFEARRVPGAFSLKIVPVS